MKRNVWNQLPQVDLLSVIHYNYQPLALQLGRYAMFSSACGKGVACKHAARCTQSILRYAEAILDVCDSRQHGKRLNVGDTS